MMPRTVAPSEPVADPALVDAAFHAWVTLGDVLVAEIIPKDDVELLAAVRASHDELTAALPAALKQKRRPG
jgi:hypothetical protein